MSDDQADICDLIIHHKERTIERILRFQSGRIISAETVGGPYVVGDWDVIRCEFVKHYAKLSYANGWLYRVEEVVDI